MWLQVTYYKLTSHMQPTGWRTIFKNNCLPLSDISHREDIWQPDESLNTPRSLLISVQIPHSLECTSELQQVISLGHQSWMNTTSSSSPSQCLGTTTSRTVSASLMPAKHTSTCTGWLLVVTVRCVQCEAAWTGWCTIKILELYCISHLNIWFL